MDKVTIPSWCSERLKETAALIYAITGVYSKKINSRFLSSRLNWFFTVKYLEQQTADQA